MMKKSFPIAVVLAISLLEGMTYTKTAQAATLDDPINPINSGSVGATAIAPVPVPTSTPVLMPIPTSTPVLMPIPTSTPVLTPSQQPDEPYPSPPGSDNRPSMVPEPVTTLGSVVAVGFGAFLRKKYSRQLQK